MEQFYDFVINIESKDQLLKYERVQDNDSVRMLLKENNSMN